MGEINSPGKPLRALTQSPAELPAQQTPDATSAKFTSDESVKQNEAIMYAIFLALACTSMSQLPVGQINGAHPLHKVVVHQEEVYIRPRASVYFLMRV